MLLAFCVAESSLRPPVSHWLSGLQNIFLLSFLTSSLPKSHSAGLVKAWNALGRVLWRLFALPQPSAGLGLVTGEGPAHLREDFSAPLPWPQTWYVTQPNNMGNSWLSKADKVSALAPRDSDTPCRSKHIHSMFFKTVLVSLW